MFTSFRILLSEAAKKDFFNGCANKASTPRAPILKLYGSRILKKSFFAASQNRHVSCIFSYKNRFLQYYFHNKK